MGKFILAESAFLIRPLHDRCKLSNVPGQNLNMKEKLFATKSGLFMKENYVLNQISIFCNRTDLKGH